MILAHFGQWITGQARLRRAGALAMIAAALATAGTTAARAQDNVVHASDVLVPVGVKTIGVSIAGSTPQLTTLMQRAFGLHGAFHVVQAGAAADYALRFDAASSNSVTVTGTPKSGGAALSQTVAGANLNDAACRAGDYVVQKLTGKPGIFAGRLAFVSKRTGYREIYESDLLMKQVLRLTSDRSDSLDPHWSPDGRKILYTGYFSTGFMQIFLIDVTTLQRRAFTNYKGINTGGVFSPDGGQVAMILSDKSQPQLYVSDAEGHNIRKLTDTLTAKSSPTWAPGGQYLALSCDPRGSPLLYFLSSLGGAMRSVPMANPLSTYCTEAAWNPVDPNLLVFTAARASGLQIVLYNFQTREAKWLMTPGDSLEPCWANDGRHVIYTSRSGSAQHLAIIDTLTGHNAVLTNSDAFQPAYVYPK